MQGQRGERLLKNLIVGGEMLVTVLPLVEVIIDVELAKIGPGQQGVAAAHKISSHIDALVGSGFVGIHGVQRVKG